jgi:DmsE family decaheme c-type cytochrome
MVIFSLTLSACAPLNRFLQPLCFWDRPAPPAPAATCNDGGFTAKLRYDSLTRGTSYDPAQLDAMVKPFTEKQFPPVTSLLPKVANAEMVNDDTLCATCHETYVRLHRTDIHRNQACEVCHGPASEHLKTRGTKPGMIVSFKTAPAANQNEVCLTCHDQQVKNRFVGEEWRTSTHAHAGNACTSCHKNHYTVPSGTPATQVGAAPAALPPQGKETQAESEAIRATYAANGAPNALACYKCHGDSPLAPKDAPKIPNMLQPGTPHQIDGPHQFKCVTCHDPHGVLRKEVRTDMCVKCHQENPMTMPWHGSSHAKSGMACVDCHNPHSPLPKLGAAEPSTCYKCHKEQAELERVASPHQIKGANGFLCVTCHNPHDNIHMETRMDRCLTCHNKWAPTMAWHSSIHYQSGVACADCHNPHPCSKVPEVVGIQHSHIDQPKRLPMSVDEPLVCYRCHPKIEALFALPQHHPVPERKMVCSSCHDAHGQAEANLKEELVNLVCYKCHADKQGPFLFEHPPVTENCAICHNPHGSMDQGMVRQPIPFLCLRCHSGHHGDDSNLVDTSVPGRARAFQRGLYMNCTQCHSQIHGTDRISNSGQGHFTR